MSKKHDTRLLQNELDQSQFFTQPQRKDLPKDTSKDLDKDSRKDVKKDAHISSQQDVITRSGNLPTADEVDEVVFRMRKARKIRINADFPEEWKQELDEYAHQAGVGKYHLVMYAVGKMLGKI